MLFVLGSVYGCVRWVGMPELPKGTANDTALYGASDKLWASNVARARKLVREPEAQHGQSAVLVSARGRLQRLLRACAWQLLRGRPKRRGRTTGRPALALCARASRLHTRPFHRL